MNRPQKRAVVLAVEDLIQLDASVWIDTATRFSCHEAEALAEVFRAAGATSLAEEFVSAHARDDDEGDDHYGKGGEA